MGSSKTANALMVRYNYLEKGRRPVILKPGLENRDGETVIKSRIGLQAECRFVESFLAQVDWDASEALAASEENTAEIIVGEDRFDAIIIDEAQFMTRKQVDDFAYIVDQFNVPVICYGLRTDFLSNVFEGSLRLLEIADVIEEVPTICWCGKKAKFQARITDGNRVVTSGSQIMLGGNESYISVCRKHYMQMLRTGEIPEEFRLREDT
jgi:thymidine kinase